MTLDRVAATVGPDPILDLHQVGPELVPLVGGKAANLGVLLNAGLPVPPGFCVTTAASRPVTGPAGLSAGLEDLRTVAAADLPALVEFANRARQQVLDASVPQPVTDAIRAAYLALGADAPVAVRSSATAEDLAFASFAGQQDSYLNVVGVEAVLDAVRRCWASLWSERAVVYRANNGIDHATVSIAVVVQRMVDVAVAGVMFTANPVTGRRQESVIDASQGLGESVVSGAVNPDHFVVDTATGRIGERRLGDKRLVIRSLPGGGTERIERQDTGTACLDDGQVRRLAALGAEVEAVYGSPQDIEWAIDGAGALWLTQSRPITTLYPQQSRAPAGPGIRVYLCLSLAQGLTRPITPMGLAGFRLIGSSIARNAGFPVADRRAGPLVVTAAGQRLFVDFTSVVRSRTGRGIVPRIFDVMEARSAAVLRMLFDDPRFSILTTSPWPVIHRVGGIAMRLGVPATLLRAAFRPQVALRRADLVGERLSKALTVPADATPRQRLGHAERLLGELFPLMPRILPLPAVGFAALALARRLLGDLAEPDDLQGVLRGLPNNITTEMDLSLWTLSARIRGSEDAAAAFRDLPAAELAGRYAAATLPPVAQAGLADFLGRYGDRAIAEIDIGMPRWSDDPTHIIGVIANYLRHDDPQLAPDRQFAAAAAEARARMATLVARAGTRGRVRAALVRTALQRTRQLAGLRELPKFYLVRALAAVRRQLAVVGAELAATGAIAEADDVFFLDFAEAERGLDGDDLRSVVAERRAAYELELRRRHIPRMLLSDGTEPETLHAPAAHPADGTLGGTPASTGIVTGIARVILDPVGARLEPGEILVAPSTDPGWTPLFLTAGGLVMEMGGANSHGAVVAREYGIPAVVGVPDATLRIVTGQRISVDGAAGTVTPAAAPS